jgi:uncharacterized protein with WD repeat
VQQPKKAEEETKAPAEKQTYEYKEHKTLSSLKVLALADTGP